MKNILFIFSMAAMVFMAACNDDDESSQKEITLQEAVENYADLVYASYLDTHTDAVALQTAINSFVASPSATTHQAAKQAWLDARETYGQTEAFRFYGGPIDDEDGPEGQLNAWPLDESHIDYVNVSGTEDAGTNIINNTADFPTITKALIAEQNENGGEANVSSGYHAIEFLLWGQDESDGAGGGERDYTDYTTASNADRRGTYLKEATALVVDDLASLLTEWETGGTYRTSFTSADNAENSLKDIVSALGKLSKGELAGERMYTAYDLRSKEDEHSCFSDNTHRDIVTNALGIQNVYEGVYVSTNGTSVSGTSIKDLLALENEELANSISDKMKASLKSCTEIQAPFDQEFLNDAGRTRILAAITLLRDQGDLLAEGAEALGFEFDPEDI